MLNLVHVTTVHSAEDNRIFRKIVLGLRNRGYKLHYIAGSSSNIDVSKYSDINFIKLKSGGVSRRVCNMFIVLLEVLKLKRGIVHFHDPELIPVCILMRVFGWEVVYDVHEDNKLGMKQKSYIPKYLRKLLSVFVVLMEAAAKRLFSIVIAEKAYKNRFPDSVMVLNYPVYDQDYRVNSREDYETLNFIYTGTISEDRGALLFVNLLKALPSARLTVVGRCKKALHQQIIASTYEVADRIYLNVSENGVPYSDIEEYYNQGEWAYGIALFPKTEHYYEKELTKFFEYLQHGIPVICSNFPVWEELIQNDRAGLCVDIDDLDRSLQLVSDQLTDAKLWKEMAHNALKTSREYTWQSQIDGLLILYKRLAEKI